MGDERGPKGRAQGATVEELSEDSHGGEGPTVTLVDHSSVTRVEPVKPQPMPIPPLEDGTRIGRYLVIEQIGAGGIGVVYKAYDPELDRAVAVKLLRPERRHSEAAGEAQGRMLREAQALARLSHPNVVSIYDVGSFEGDVFLAMEYVQGKTLRDWIKEYPSLDEIVDAFIAAGRGLAAAHDAGLVHRDFKPSNVWIGDDGRVRVLDFGLARLAADTAPDTGDALTGDTTRTGPKRALRESSHDHSDTPPSSERLTHTGALMGTPRYMAPEQHRGAATDHRTDQFSFCVALFEAVHGKRPFAGRTVPELRHNVTRGNLREVKAEHKIPQRVRRAMLRGLSTEPGDRYPNMHALLRDLERRRYSTAYVALAAAVATSAVVAAIAWVVSPGRPSHALCDGGDGAIERAWNEPRSREVGAAFSATGKPYAERNYLAFVDAVDDYAATWRRARAGACNAVSDGDRRALAEARLDCLAERADELAAFVDVYRDEVDADALANAVPAAHRLTPLDVCMSTQPLRLAGRSNDSDIDRDRAIALRRQLARARGSSKAGRDAACVDIAGPAVAEAEALGDPALHARALLLHGNCLAEVNELEQARTQLERAVQRATESGDPTIETEAWLALIGSVCVDEGRPSNARAMLPAAEAAFARAGAPPYLETRLLSRKALIADALGDYRGAIEHELRAIELATEHNSKDVYAIAILHNNIGVSYARSGQWEEAGRHLRKAIELNEAELGPDHPLLGNAYNTLGGVFYEDRAFEAAEAAWRRSLAIRQAAHGPDHPLLARVLPNLAMLAFERRDYDRAEELLERALSNQATLGPNHPESTGILMGLADIALERGAAPQANELCARASSILSMAQVTATHEDRPYALTCIGRARVAGDDLEGAVEPLEQAIAMFEDGEHAPDPRAAAQTRASLARALWAREATRDRALHVGLQALVQYAELPVTAQLEHERAELSSWLCARRGRISTLRELPDGASEALRCR